MHWQARPLSFSPITMARGNPLSVQKKAMAKPKPSLIGGKVWMILGETKRKSGRGTTHACLARSRR
jgi:hypothetical protein